MENFEILTCEEFVNLTLPDTKIYILEFKPGEFSDFVYCKRFYNFFVEQKKEKSSLFFDAFFNSLIKEYEKTGSFVLGSFINSISTLNFV